MKVELAFVRDYGVQEYLSYIGPRSAGFGFPNVSEHRSCL
jgi:hypothetical protein